MNDQDDLKIYTDFMHELANAAAAVSLKYFKKHIDVESKGSKLGTSFDPVTIADQNTEKAIRELIRLRFPNHNIRGEEQAEEQKGSNFTWVIDPIDGTRAYITGIPTWATLVSLHDGHKPIVGLLDQPYLKERYIGTANATFFNGTKISARPCDDIFKATISTTDPLQLFNGPVEQDAFFRVASRAKMMRNGYDSYAYAMIAAGFIDIVIESGLEPHDIQALIPIIEGAGGIVTNWQGEPCDKGGQVLACGDKRLHEQVVKLLNITTSDL
ncbi:MAG: histidinol-phosphatase [Kordiimonadaceae bacterium]|nr:histidinol-phosphatase [Kordiimonadaceae bacterium]